MSVDVIVIGAGMAGASVAAELAVHGSVVALEAEHSAGVHSTGRSAASYLPSYGGSVVRRLTAASRPMFDELSAYAAVELLRPRPLIWIAHDATSIAALNALEMDQPELEWLTVEQVTDLCPALRPDQIQSAALDTSSSDIDVAALHQTYLAQIRRRGSLLHLNARVHAIERRGGAWRIHAGNDVYDCGLLVDAAGAWADQLAELAHVPKIGLRPTRRSVFHAPVPGAEVPTHWPIVLDGAERWYFKPESPYLLASPADESDSPPCDARADELAIARAIEDINTVTNFGLRSVKTAWAGLRSFVADRAPVVGAWPEHPGFHFLAGQGGYGIQMAPALARVAAEIVRNGQAAGAGVTADELAPARLRSPA